MKRHWNIDELIDDWTLQPGEMALVTQVRTAKNRLGLALLLKWFQYENRFPRRRQEVPPDVVGFLAHQLAVQPDVFQQYAWQGRTIARHRMLVRELFLSTIKRVI